MLTNMSLWVMAAANTDLPFPTVFVLGFGTVFVGLLALILIITLLGKIMKGTNAKEAQKAVTAAPAPQSAAPVAAAAPAPAPAAASLAAGEVVKSPMPGNILKINVSSGQKVKEGDVLIVLEAMKMENDIVAPKAGTVAQIAVSKGQVVETGSPLVVIA